MLKMSWAAVAKTLNWLRSLFSGKLSFFVAQTSILHLTFAYKKHLRCLILPLILEDYGLPEIPTVPYSQFSLQ